MTTPSFRSLDFETVASPAAAEPAAWPLADLGERRPRGAGPSAQELAAAEEVERQRAEELQAAYERGYAEGKADARQEETLRLERATAAANEAIQRIQQGQPEWERTVRDNLCALAAAVARHLVGRELTDDQAAVATLVRQALANFPADQPVLIRINPHDLSLLSTVSSPGGEAIPVAPGRDVRWLPDEAVESGGCVIEGPHRIVDGRIDHALERIYRKLSDAG